MKLAISRRIVGLSLNMSLVLLSIKCVNASRGERVEVDVDDADEGD
jgi:hypothetical protein